MFCIFLSESGDCRWNVWWVITRTSKSWQTHRYTHTHTDTGDDNTRRPKGPRVKNCCDAFIQMKWVLFPIAMNRSSGYNTICCPAISAKLRCFEIPCQVWRRQRVAHVRGSRMSRSHDLTCRTLRVNLRLPNCLVCWVSVSRMRQPCAQPVCK